MPKIRLAGRYDNATVGSGSIVNHSQFAYNDFGQLTKEYQSHAGAVDVMGNTPKVEYAFADGASNTIRPTGMVYPNGRELVYSYGDADSIDDVASRIVAIIDDDDTTLVAYEYLGRGTFVVAHDSEPDVKWTLVSLTGSDDPDTGDIYTGLDRFGRVKDNRWHDVGSAVDVDRIKYGYDRAGNRIWRQNVVAGSLGKEFDELYTYDGIQRLKEMTRGTLNSTKTALASETFGQCWTLDSTGNWQGFREDGNGDGTWDLVQARTSNTVNEITDITNSVGSGWVDPVYNAAGNMTTMPQPMDPTQSFAATYDGWNRLVKIAEGSATVSEYAYDGSKRRIVQKSYTAGSLTETRHMYYTSSWQSIEERLGASPDTADAERQFIWGLRYIDDCVLRDRDADNDSSLDERLYALQDGNWNVTGFVDDAAAVQERYAYAAYGQPMFLTPLFSERSASSYAWESLYCGYRYESATGVFHVRNRVYHPVVGSWVQRDPLGYVDGMGLYGYADGHVLTFTDPAGMIRVSCQCVHHTFAKGGGKRNYYSRETECSGLADACCNAVCQSLASSWTGDWRIVTLQYGKNSPPTEIFVCQRFVEPGTPCKGVIDSCGGQHTYIQFGGVDAAGRPLPGTSGIGFSGGAKGSLPSKEKAFTPTQCRRVTRSGLSIMAGVGRGRNSATASSADLEDCLRNALTTASYSWWSYNCTHWVADALAQCGLK